MATVSSSKEELELEQLQLANRKIVAETEKLEREARPERWWTKLTKNIVLIGGIGTVIATAYGVYDSYNKTIADRERARIVDQRSRFEDAIKRIESPSTVSKLLGGSVLSGYLNAQNSNVHKQILFALASLIATERDYQAQAAVTDLIAAIPPSGPITQEAWTYFQDMLVSQSKALVAKGMLGAKRHRDQSEAVSDEERSAQNV